MKPVQLEATNFGPYRRMKINFEALEQAPLFLISGDTGAGKSTLFDAMTVALFSQTTGERKVEEMRSTFATPEDALTQVIFYFRQHDTLYKLERTIKQEKKATRGQKVIEHKPTASLTIVDAISGSELEQLASKPSDVGQMIQELLQINAEQFKQIVLLPQNEVQKFLHSKTEEKLPILKTIFGTQIFTQFTKALEEHYRTAKKDAEALQQKLTDLYASPSFPEAVQEKIATLPEAEKAVYIKEALAQAQEEQQAAQRDAKAASQSYKDADKQYQDATVLATKTERLAELKRRYQTQISEQAVDYETKKQAWMQFEELRPLATIVEYRQRDQAKLAELKEKTKQATEKLAALKATQKAIIAQLDTLKHQEQEQAAKQTLLSQLAAYDQANQEIKTEEERQHQAKQLQQQARSEQKAFVIEQERLLNEQVELEAKLLDPKVEHQQAQHVQQLNTMGIAYQEIVDTLATQEAAYHIQQTQLETSKEDLQVANQEHTALIKKVATLESRRRELMIAQLQAELTPGAPCVVCGATTHEVQTDVVADEAQLLEQIKQLDVARQAYETSQLTCAQLEHRCTQTTEALQQQHLLLQELHDRKAACYHAMEQIVALSFTKEASLEDVQTFIKAYEQNHVDQTIQQEEYKARLVALQSALSKLEIELAQVQQTIDQQDFIQISAQETIDKRMATYPNLDRTVHYAQQKVELTAEIEAYAQEYETITRALDEQKQLCLTQELTLENLATQQQTLADAIVQATTKIQQSLPESMTEQEAITSLAQVDEAKQWADFVHRYEEQERYLTEEIATLTATVNAQEQPDVAQLLAVKEQTEQAYQAATTQATRLATLVEQMEKVVQTIMEILEKQGVKGQEFNELSELYQTIKGTKGSKLKLETFVAQEYLTRVLEHANRHYIRELTGGRYEFLLNTSRQSGQRDTGLDIDVFDFSTGTIRSTKTLSGGETFIAALSIALSLSEVVQNTTNGALIEALFIDEGFGSLDRDTLEQAMVALEQIGENRMVGVISHVDEMKERIAQQIWIKKLGNGQSTLKVQELK